MSRTAWGPNQGMAGGLGGVWRAGGLRGWWMWGLPSGVGAVDLAPGDFEFCQVVAMGLVHHFALEVVVCQVGWWIWGGLVGRALEAPGFDVRFLMSCLVARSKKQLGG